MVESAGLEKVAIIFSAGNAGSPENAAESGVLETVDAVAGSLEKGGYSVDKIELFPPFSALAARVESLPPGSAVFNLFEGFGDDPLAEVQVAILLESVGLRYTGCPPFALHMGLDKSRAKGLFTAAGLPVTRGARVDDISSLNAHGWEFPLFVKPNYSDASHGIGASNIVCDESALKEKAAELLSRFSGGVVIEPFLGGREFNCSVLGDGHGAEPLPPSMVDYSALPAGHPPVLTFSAKWEPENPVYQGTPTICPAPVKPGLVEKIQRLAGEAFLAAGCRGYARVDFREDEAGNLFILELNPNPDLSPSAGLAKQARAAGLDYDGLVKRVLDMALA